MADKEKKDDPMDKVRAALRAAPRTHPAGKKIGRMVVHVNQPKKKGK